MKNVRRLFPLLCAIIGFASLTPVASAAIDFSPAGNLPVQVKMEITRFSVGGSTTEGLNLVSPTWALTNDFRTLSLPDGGVLFGDFAGQGNRPVNEAYSLGGSFALSDAGDFALIFNDGSFGDPEPTSVGGRFTLTLQGLLPQDGTILTGFNYVTGSEWFYELMTFDFSQAASGTVVVSGNIPVDAVSISGYFTSSAIPEPATVALALAAAAAGITAWRRRRAA